MTRYEILVFLHVLAVIVWVGGGVMLQILLGRARKAGPDDLASFTDAAEWTSQRVFMPTSFAVLGLGIWLVVDSPWNFSDPWIGIGIVGYALSALNGMINLGPTSRKMKELIAERGPADPGVQTLARRIGIAGRLDLLVLVAVVFDMVVKPGV
ncbi:MAG: DUF2269 family protein [Actinomycetota bacterium]